MEKRPIPIAQLVRGCWYNAAIQFKPISAGGRVPNALPKHRVFLYSVNEDNRRVSVFYMTTFGGKTPESFHGRRSPKIRQYIAVGNAAVLGGYASNYLAIPTMPDVLHGWIDFELQISIKYDEVIDRQKLRAAPEASCTPRPSPLVPLESPTRLFFARDHSPQPQVPLQWDPIISPDWVRAYITEIVSAWNLTVVSSSPGDNWLTAVKKLNKRFTKKRKAEERRIKKEELKWGPEWDGIHGLSDEEPVEGSTVAGGSKTSNEDAIGSRTPIFDGNGDDDDSDIVLADMELPQTPGHLGRVPNPLLTPAPSQMPTPQSMPPNPTEDDDEEMETTPGDFDPYITTIELYGIDLASPWDGVKKGFVMDAAISALISRGIWVMDPV